MGNYKLRHAQIYLKKNICSNLRYVNKMLKLPNSLTKLVDLGLMNLHLQFNFIDKLAGE